MFGHQQVYEFRLLRKVDGTLHPQYRISWNDGTIPGNGGHSEWIDFPVVDEQTEPGTAERSARERLENYLTHIEQMLESGEIEGLKGSPTVDEALNLVRAALTPQPNDVED